MHAVAGQIEVRHIYHLVNGRPDVDRQAGASHGLNFPLAVEACIHVSMYIHICVVMSDRVQTRPGTHSPAHTSSVTAMKLGSGGESFQTQAMVHMHTRTGMHACIIIGLCRR